jgi:type VI secretion system protein ImpD
LFKKVYSEEFDMPGGEPFGLLIGDYQVRHRPSLEHPVDDVAVLRGISQVAAAAFAPFVASAHPALFGLDSFRELGLPIDLQAVFRQLEYLPWRSFRESEDARFVGLTLPRILLRTPYEDDGSRVDGFHFHEDVEGSDNSRYLWGNAAYAFAAVAIQAFDSHGWLADIRGVRQDPTDHHLIAGGGLVSGLPVHSFSTDRSGLIPKYSTAVLITAEREKELEELGFISLCHCWDTEWSAFYSNASVQAPKQYDTVAATVNARLSAMLQYTLCVARFAHYLKLLGRAKTGSFTRAEELQNYLQTWLQQYTTARDSASYTDKARYPLREARVQVSEHPGKPGCYLCVAHLRPHFQLEQLIAAIKLETEITPVE